MNEITVSFPTDSGCTGMSRPVFRKGIMLFSSFILGLTEGTEVEILGEEDGYYRVWPLSRPLVAQRVPKELIREVHIDARRKSQAR